MTIKEIKIQLALNTLNPARLEPGDVVNIKAPAILDLIYKTIIKHYPAAPSERIPEYVFREFAKNNYKYNKVFIDLLFYQSFYRSNPNTPYYYYKKANLKI